MARPRIEIDPEEFAKLCEIMCTVEEIAGFFDCSVDTIERFCHRTYKVGFAEIYKRLSSPGKISLRRAQFRLAETNATMAIFLGKQYLGQKDVVPGDSAEEEAALTAIVEAMKEASK